MPLIDAAIWEQVVDPNPFILAPDVLLSEVVARFTQPDSSAITCAFVVENSRLVGVVTTHTIFRLVSLPDKLHGVKVVEVMAPPKATLCKANLKEISDLVAHAQAQPAHSIAIVDEHMQLLEVVCPYRLQAYLWKHLAQWQHQITQLQVENTQRSHLLNQKGKVDQYVAIQRDLTECQQAETALQSTNAAMAALFSAMTDLILVFDAQGRCLKTPVDHQRLYGHSGDRLGKTLHDTFSQDLADYFLSCIHQCLETQTTINVEYKLAPQNGQEKWFDARVSPIDETTVIWVCRDTTERKRSEEQLKASLHEKELLLKEVHHRVKNNMQVISSIFSLQSQHITDSKILSILADSQNRIRSMALIHEKLYQSTSLAKVDFADYIRSLIQNLLATYRDVVNKTRLTLNISDISLDVDTAIPCGLLINELVSNSLKHAFQSQLSGEIIITFMNSDLKHLHLIVRDTGKGLPNDLNTQQASSLGLRLVRALSRQLNGKWDIYNDHGTVFEIVFPKRMETCSF